MIVDVYRYAWISLRQPESLTGSPNYSLSLAGVMSIPCNSGTAYKVNLAESSRKALKSMGY